MASSIQPLSVGALIASGIIIISPLLAWVKVNTIFGSIPLKGIDSNYGTATFIVGVAGAVVAAAILGRIVPYRPATFVLAIVGMVAVGIGIMVWMDLSGEAAGINEDTDLVSTSVGIGVILLMLAGIVLTVMAGFLLSVRGRGRRRRRGGGHG